MKESDVSKAGGPHSDEQLEREQMASSEANSDEVRQILEKAPGFGRSWNKAQDVIKDVAPVSWSIWRMASYVIGSGLKINPILDGMLLGYSSFINTLTENHTFAGDIFDEETEESPSRRVRSDLVIACLILHSTIRRLNGYPLKRIWMTFIEEALNRARVGYLVGERGSQFGAGRGIIAGFACQIGLVILLATGDESQASRSLKGISEGRKLNTIGLDVFGIEPSHLGAQLLLQAGLGVDAALGVLSYDSEFFLANGENQENWSGAVSVIEAGRSGTFNRVKIKHQKLFGLESIESKEEFIRQAQSVSRTGHQMDWLR